jgi:hypothetical protein
MAPSQFRPAYSLRRITAAARSRAFRQARQDCENGRRDADRDGELANHRQPQQQDLPYSIFHMRYEIWNMAYVIFGYLGIIGRIIDDGRSES